MELGPVKPLRARAPSMASDNPKEEKAWFSVVINSLQFAGEEAFELCPHTLYRCPSIPFFADCQEKGIIL
jgi:hypothetical protein